MCAHRRKMVGPQEKTATYKLRREASEKPILLTPWSPSVSNREKIKCLFVV